MYLGRMGSLLICLFGTFVLLFSSGVVPTDIVKVTKVDDPPVIDGKLNDPAWQK